jgi:hypothetical protein
VVNIVDGALVQEKNRFLGREPVIFNDMESISESIDVLLSMDDDSWSNRGHVVPVLKKIAIESARRGMDLSLLPAMYDIKSREEIQDFLASADVFFMHRDVESFSTAYELFFETDDSPVNEKILMDSRLKGLSIVRTDMDAPSNILFEYWGLIDLGNGLYHKVDSGASNEELYDALYALHVRNFPICKTKNAFSNH